MTDDLIAQLQSHSRAFDGLMSLIPADYYYGKDNDDQWKRKKQTKEEKRAAKRAKLDPEAYKSALDVHKERERKRKCELEGESDASSDLDGPREKPREGMKPLSKPSKKQKREKPSAQEEDEEEDEEAVRKAKAEKKRAKRERQKAKRAHKREKKEAKKVKKQQERDGSFDSAGIEAAVAPAAKKVGPSSAAHQEQRDNGGKKAREILADHEVGSDSEEELEDDEPDSNQIETLDFNGLAEDNDDGDLRGDEQQPDDDDESISNSSRSPSLARDTPTFDESSAPSSASSSSSINPPSEPDLAKSPDLSAQPPPADETTAKVHPINSNPQGKEDKPSKLPPVNQEVLKQRLAERIAALRAQRKADGLDGKPARNRAELIEARRRKEEARRAAKKEQRAKAKEHDAEAEAARLRGGSDSPLWSSPGVFGPPRSPQQDNSNHNFSFGKLKFEDGTEIDSSLARTTDPQKRKGPQDPKTALEAAQHKASRLNGLDASKRADIEEKDRWLNARKRADGEKPRDDVSLLKKALKRKTKAKEKSEKEWKERNDGVQKSIQARQAKRAENIAKRKDGKGGKKAGAGGKAAPKPKRRPGFEGSFKTGKRNVL